MPDTFRKDNHVRDSRPKETQPLDKTVQNTQDVFLNNLRRDRTLVTVFLMGGVKLTGKIKSFDKYAVILETNSQEQLVFKHAISTVVVARSAQPATQAIPQAEEA
jgi:host factor-I protein